MINRIYHSCSCIIESNKFVAKINTTLDKPRILSRVTNSFNKLYIP